MRRTPFNEQRHKRFDTIGKRLGKNLLDYQYGKSRKFIVQPIVELKKCGDISVLDLDTGKYQWFEIEVRSVNHFEKNFNKCYSTLDIPIKKFETIQDGIYFVFDESEEHNESLPNRFMAIKISDILKCNKTPKFTKYNNNEKEYFYNVPYEIVKFYSWSESYNEYIEH